MQTSSVNALAELIDSRETAHARAIFTSVSGFAVLLLAWSVSDLCLAVQLLNHPQNSSARSAVCSRDV